VQAVATVPEKATVIVPLARLDRAALAAMAYALSISTDVTAVHVETHGMASKRIRERWRTTHDGVRLDLLAPSGTAADRIASYVDDRAVLDDRSAIMVVIPTVAPRMRWLYPFVNWGAIRLARRLARRRSFAVVTAPYRI
jgi:hypothetical protein